MESNYFEMMQLQNQAAELSLIKDCNDKTSQFGLSLSTREAKQLIIAKNNSLKKQQRVEFGNSILDKLIFFFCDSQYIGQDNYLDTLMELQDIFYLFKNETQDKLSDDELLQFMRKQYEDICMGDTEYLAGTCLERLSLAIRSGYRNFERSGGKIDYEQFNEEQRWDKELYMKAVKELFWG